jgi:hypothetical protein
MIRSTSVFQTLICPANGDRHRVAQPPAEHPGDHQIAVVALRAHVNAHVPCRREIDLETVQLRDQLRAPIRQTPIDLDGGVWRLFRRGADRASGRKTQDQSAKYTIASE